MRTSWIRRAVAAALLPAALVLGSAAPVSADVPEQQRCLLFVDDGTVFCAATLEEADVAFSAATGYTRVVDGVSDSQDGLLLAYTLAALYPNNGYGGLDYTFVRSSPCDGVTVTAISDLATIGMNNSVSSFQTYGTCQVRLYDGTAYTGTFFGYTTSSASVGALNDAASSVRVR